MRLVAPIGLNFPPGRPPPLGATHAEYKGVVGPSGEFALESSLERCR